MSGEMTPTFSRGRVENVLVGVLVAGGLIVLFTMYLRDPKLQFCAPRPVSQHVKKPILLVWFWPEDQKFDLNDCRTHYNMDACILTDDKNLFYDAEAVLIYNKAINSDLSNLPSNYRPPFQRWIWFSTEPPSKTTILPGIQHLFNLTMTFRKDADISVHPRVFAKKQPQEFVLPTKEELVCWISDEKVTGAAEDYFTELKKHLNITVLGQAFAKPLFYLSFESETTKDYITEKLNAPLVAGTLPVVLGPPRKNYEDFVPGDSFIHVNDFPSAKELAEFLLKLDADGDAYQRYFLWRRYLSARPRPAEVNKHFLPDICLACEHVGRKRVFRRVPDLNKWFLEQNTKVF
uniref:Fucosyltransferase n=1 Tax=Denticeps clupeoides TaxID=299321 RepID=A0AAY4DVN8_9TELE